MAKLITVGPKNCFFRSKLQSRSRCASRSDSSLTQSALLVAVPEAEPLVSTWRLKLDPVAARGVPAHITVLFPFLEPSEIDDDTVATLHELVSAHRRFNFDCVAVEFFDTDVMWLRPEPARGFLALTAAIFRAFPNYAPYGGSFEEPQPHLTVGQGGSFSRLKVAAEELAPQLPLRAEAIELLLMVGGPAPVSWTVRNRFILP